MKKIRRINFHSIWIFDELSLVIIMGDFYQFAPIQRRVFWGNSIGEEEVYKKSFRSRFTSILILIEQMCQKTDLRYWKMLKRVKEGKLDLQDV